MNRPEPPPLPKRPAPPPAPPRGGGPEVDPPSRPAGPASPPASGDALPSKAVQLFRQKARLILAEQQGMTAKSRAILDHEARQLGLSQAETDEAIRSLRNAEPPVVQPLGQSPGAPPVQSSAAKAPHEVFHERVQKALAKSSKVVLSAANERRLVDRGADKLGLSRVLARQIVHRIAKELNMRIASQDAAAAESGREETLSEHPELPAFLERAAAILAEQRGINARSRVLLSAAASELGLSDAELEHGISALTGAPEEVDDETQWQQEREQAFQVHLCKTLALLPHKVATIRMQQTWIGEGRQKFALDESTAQQMVRDVAAEQDVRLVTEDQAAGHVKALVESLLGDTGRLDDATRARVFAEGSQWGLTPMQVDAIIRDQIRAKGRADNSLSGVTGTLIAAFSGCFLALVGLIAWLLVFRSEPPDDIPQPIVIGQLGGQEGPVQPSIEAPTGDEWWSRDEDLLVAVTQARVVIPEMKDALLGLSVTDAEDRTRVYRRLVRVAAHFTDQADRREVIEQLIAGCYASDPSDECATALADELLKFVPASDEDLPDTQDAYQAAFWAIGSAVTALARPNLSQERRDELARQIDRAIGATIDPTLAPLELQRTCFQAFCQHLYRVVTGHASQDPHAAFQLYQDITRRAARYLDRRTIELANVEFLTAALPAAGEEWLEFVNLIQYTVNSADPLVVLRLVDLFERLENESLQDFVKVRLLQRAGIFPHSLTANEVAQKVREALGAEEVTVGAGRRETLEKEAAKLFATLDNPDLTDEEQLQQIIDLSHVATMACALAQEEVGQATFDSLQRDGPVQLRAWRTPPAYSTRPRSARQPSRQQQESLNRYVTYLLNPRGSRIQRNVFLRSISTFAVMTPDLEPSTAEKLASYVLRQKPDDEHQGMLEFIEPMGRWNHLKLALADQILDTRLKKERCAEILSRVLPTVAALDDEQDWKQQAHELLLTHVLNDLAQSESRESSPDRIFDDLSAALRESYVTQSRLLGVSPDQYASALGPNDLLRLMAEKTSEEISKVRLAAPAERHLESLPYQFDAIQYAGSNDLQRTVLLQRLWLRTLAASVSQAGGNRASQAGALVTDLEQADLQANDIFVQMRDGELALAKMWLLVNANL